MPKPYPREFRDDVVAVARNGQAPLSQIAKDFGISEGSLTNWLKKADPEDGKRPGLSDDERQQLREANKRIRLLEQENEVLRRAAAYLSQAKSNEPDSPSDSTRSTPISAWARCTSAPRSTSWSGQATSTPEPTTTSVGSLNQDLFEMLLIENEEIIDAVFKPDIADLVHAERLHREGPSLDEALAAGVKLAQDEEGPRSMRGPSSSKVRIRTMWWTLGDLNP